MKHSQADWVFFADQDDVWKKEKLARMIERFRVLEKEVGASRPLLLHTDLEVMDQAGGLISSSFWSYASLNPLRACSFNRILMQNPVTGCAMMTNRALIQKGGSLPPEAIMHDGWLALVAAAFGRVEAMAETCVRYRQHSHNVIGARPFSLMGGFNKSKEPFLKQGAAFLNQFRAELPDSLLNTLSAYLSLPDLGYFESRKILIKNRFYKQGTLRNLFHLALPYE